MGIKTNDNHSRESSCYKYQKVSSFWELITMTNGVENFHLFPEPSLIAPSRAPSLWPGANATTTKALVEILKDNHDKYHIFYDDVGRHK